MKRIFVVFCTFALAALPATAAQLYRWVDDKGNVEWRDTPPPPTAKKVEQRNLGVSTIPTSGLPYSVQQAAKNFPVTLWITDCGDACDKARAHLVRRGVPYTEKNARSDVEGFKKATGGSLEVPLLMVGTHRLKGYLESEWDSTLDLAGYPRTPPIGYKAPPRAPEPKPAPPPPPSAVPSSPAEQTTPPQ